MRIITSALLSGLLVLLAACGGNGSKSQSASISSFDDPFGQIKSRFVDQGIPAVLDEFAAVRGSNPTGETLQRHPASRACYRTT